jgi:hypothetical protein
VCISDEALRDIPYGADCVTDLPGDHCQLQLQHSTVRDVMHRARLCPILVARSFTPTRTQPTIRAFTREGFKVE